MRQPRRSDGRRNMRRGSWRRPVAVGTVDQAMLAGLQVKHAHLRGSALSRSLLVIDEVHASDSYMTEILKHLLDGHLAAGGYAMLMSATLGATARAHWTDKSLPDHETASTTPYPAVWVKGENVPRAPAEAGRSKTVRPETLPTMEPAEAASRAVAVAERGARVLVIRNTVSMAVATWRAVIDAGAESMLMQVADESALHHGRFAVEDRELLDRTVEKVLGPVAEREPHGCIVIGTQTLEQSLDIDADLLITDLCPMDVLLQRYRPAASACTAATGGTQDRARGGVVAGQRAGPPYGTGVRERTRGVEDGRRRIQRDLPRPRGFGADSTATPRRRFRVAHPGDEPRARGRGNSPDVHQPTDYGERRGMGSVQQAP